MIYAIGIPGQTPRLYVNSPKLANILQQVQAGETALQIFGIPTPRAVTDIASARALIASDANDAQNPSADLTIAERDAWTNYSSSVQSTDPNASGGWGNSPAYVQALEVSPENP
jgi:hypothetical protein